MANEEPVRRLTRKSSETMPDLIFADIKAIHESLSSIADEQLTDSARHRISRACADLERLDEALERSMKNVGRSVLQAVDEFGEYLRREDPRIAKVRKLEEQVRQSTNTELKEQLLMPNPYSKEREIASDAS